MLYLTCFQFHEDSIKNPDPHSQIESYEAPRAKYPNENYSKDTGRKKISVTPNFIPQILPEDGTAAGINSLNSKQKEVFNVVHTWTTDYVKYDGHDVEPVPIFLSGSGGISKSHSVKVIYSAISKALLCHCNDPEK